MTYSISTNVPSRFDFGSKKVGFVQCFTIYITVLFTFIFEKFDFRIKVCFYEYYKCKQTFHNN